MKALPRRRWLAWLGAGLWPAGAAWAQSPAAPPKPAAKPATPPKAPPAPKKPVSGQVEKLQGRAQLERHGQRVALRLNDKVYEGDRLVTSEGAELVLRMTDGSVVALRQNTDLTLEGYQFTREDSEAADGDRLLVNLAVGAMRMVTGLIGKLNTPQLRIVTPTATIGVRGTDFETVVIEAEDTEEEGEDEEDEDEDDAAPGAARPIEPAGDTLPEDAEPGADEKASRPGTYTTVFSGLTTLESDGMLIEVGPGQAAFSPADAMARAREFGLLQRVPRRLFRQGPFDRLLGGLQQDTVNRLQQELGKRLQRQLPPQLQRLMPGQFNPFGTGSGGNPFIPDSQSNPFIPGNGQGSGGAAPAGNVLDLLRRR